MAGVFLSYRRVESDWATKLARSLANRFGKDLVFQDVEDIAGGDRWRDRIQAAIETAEIVLVVIGPQWLVDEQQRRRLDDPEDVLRAELSEALKLGRAIIPVLVGGATMPASDDIPGELADLSEHQAMSLADSAWNENLERLLERVRGLLLPGRDTEPLERVQREVHERQVEFFALLDQDRLADALEVAQRTLDTLNRVSPLYPDDLELQTARGYTYKNCGIGLRDFGRADEAASNLDQADAVFDTLLEEYPDDPAAWDGKGSVLATRGDLEASLPYFERAIELKPDYVEARRNRDMVVQALGARSDP
ncbi:MAG TPA: TIR domain-containing protein [Thermoleophilaceae bacterium]|jgi:tetratricopeptide (TPR) repeat protein|nr:TIR domain-containing protein [Thermoleophilaceae bacterium]